MKHVFGLLLCVSASAFTPATLVAAAPDEARIPGIVVAVGVDSIQTKKDATLPSGMDLIAGSDPGAEGVNELSVKIGESFSIADRHHVGTTYTLLEITYGRATIEATTWTHFPGDVDAHETVRTLHVRSYDLGVPSK